MIERRIEIASRIRISREVAVLLQASDAYMASLYPAESNHMLDVGLAAAAAGGVPGRAGRWQSARLRRSGRLRRGLGGGQAHVRLHRLRAA